MATEALRNLLPRWKGRWGRGKGPGTAVILEERGGEDEGVVVPPMSWAGA